MNPLYSDLLTAAHANHRLWGISRWEECFGAREEIVPLLEDTAPVLREHGGRTMIIEVRNAALVALQDSYRRARDAWDLGPVTVRAGMPAAEAVTRAAELLAGLTPERRQAVVTAADLALAERVRPIDRERAACHAYLVLQELGEVAYLVQEVDERTWLTPLQADVHASQMTSARPTPHLRFDGEHGQPVGYLYRAPDAHGVPYWVLDLSEDPMGRTAGEHVRRWRGVERGGVPRLVFDEEGRPRRDGTAFVFDGVVPDDTDEPLDWLRSVAAFVSVFQPCHVVRRHQETTASVPNV